MPVQVRLRAHAGSLPPVKARRRQNAIVDALSSHNATYSHSRHIHIDELVNLGLKIVPLEELDNRSIDDCKDLQDCVLTIHHSFMQTLASTNALKIVENHAGQAMIITASQQA